MAGIPAFDFNLALSQKYLQLSDCHIYHVYWKTLDTTARLKFLSQLGLPFT